MHNFQCTLSISLVSCKKMRVLVLVDVCAPGPASLAACLARKKISLSGSMARRAAPKNDMPAAVQKSERHVWLTLGTRYKLMTAASK